MIDTILSNSFECNMFAKRKTCKTIKEYIKLYLGAYAYLEPLGTHIMDNDGLYHDVFATTFDRALRVLEDRGVISLADVKCIAREEVDECIDHICAENFKNEVKESS